LCCKLVFVYVNFRDHRLHHQSRLLVPHAGCKLYKVHTSQRKNLLASTSLVFIVVSKFDLSKCCIIFLSLNCKRDFNVPFCKVVNYNSTATESQQLTSVTLWNKLVNIIIPQP
jgi:hypothetical protein